MRIPVEMHDIRLRQRFEIEQPGASRCHIVPGFLHPFELPGTL